MLYVFKNIFNNYPNRYSFLVIQLIVKKYTMERLSDIYRTSCLKQAGDYDWIPGRILRCLYDEDIGYVNMLPCLAFGYH